MLGEGLKDSIANSLTDHLGVNLIITDFQSVGGGSINRAGIITTNEGRFFVKWNDANAYPNMFELEQKGLDILRKADAICVPKTYCTGSDGQQSFLVMELLEGGKQISNFYSDYGEKLVALHRNTAKQHGLDHDNYIGSLPQKNYQHDKWVDFFIEQRMEPMVTMARNKGEIDGSVVAQFEQMYERLPAIMPEEPPSMMHGDLWGGNHITGPDGSVCLIDPAVYYGSREMEIAFTQVFSGYPNDFYRSYENHWPLEPGFEKRKDFYKLWPLMVHVNLFGSSYLPPVKRILKVF